MDIGPAGERVSRPRGEERHSLEYCRKAQMLLWILSCLLAAFAAFGMAGRGRLSPTLAGVASVLYCVVIGAAFYLMGWKEAGLMLVVTMVLSGRLEAWIASAILKRRLNR